MRKEELRSECVLSWKRRFNTKNNLIKKCLSFKWKRTFKHTDKGE